GSVEKVHVEFTHGINLINTAGGACAEKSEVVIARVEGELRAIEAAAHRGKTEIADEALRDTSVDESGEAFVRGRYFSAIEKRETAETQLPVGGKSEAHISLSDKAVRVVLSFAVGGIV